MSNVMMWSLILGFISSNFLLPLLMQPGWSTRKRSLVTLAFSVVIGFINAWVAGELILSDITASILTLLVTAIAIYEGLAKKIGLAPAIENATSRSTEVNNE